MRRISHRVVLLVVLLTACAGFGQFGPWLDESGQRLEGSQVVQYRGFEQCGHEQVIFLVFFGAMYAQDRHGVLGELHGANGDVLTYAVLDEIPEGVTATGITTTDREIYFDEDTRADYIYIHRDTGRTERWPRAEIACDRPGSSQAVSS
ncbi:MAG: hypothetical protein ACRDWH_08300 [Acidimicrobiia bacterium]